MAATIADVAALAGAGVKQRPETVGQAARIQGITPAAISLLLVHLKRRAGAARIEKSA